MGEEFSPALDGMDIDNDFWEELLLRIEERRVIPVIGPELMASADGLPFVKRVARELAARLRLPAGDLPESPEMGDVVAAHLNRRGRREDLYAKIKVICRDLATVTPPPLRHLAAIRDFDLFVTLSFDSLMVQALDEARHGSRARTSHLAFAPNRPQDVAPERLRSDPPIVYALLGKVSSMPEYAISDEDTLEFLHALQSESRRPKVLFDELQNNHLLMLGCSFPDWLARFFIRIAKSRQLSAQRAEVETIVEQRIARDPGLILFLERFSYGTRVVATDPAAFVAELARRWQARQQGHPRQAKAAQEQAEPESGVIFISYASEDLAAANRLGQSLQDRGLDVWFDKQRLSAGEVFDQTIRRRIKACSLFVPLISANTELRLEGWFRREWRLAEERAEGIAAQVPFIVPVAIDDTPFESASVPAAFTRTHCTRVPEGQGTDEFADRLTALVRAFRKRQLGMG